MDYFTEIILGYQKPYISALLNIGYDTWEVTITLYMESKKGAV